MHRFDLDILRKTLLDRVGGFDWYLKLDLEESRERKALAFRAESQLGVAFQCLLLGFHEPAHCCAKRAQDWLARAIAENEMPSRYFKHGTEGRRYFSLAMCNWLLHGKQDQESLRLFVKHYNLYLDERASNPNRQGIGLVLPEYMNAKAYERVVDIFLSVPGWKPPQNLRRIHGEAQMCYVMARHRLGAQYEANEVNECLHRFLTANMHEWLGGGHYTQAAVWLKLAYWDGHESEITPEEAVLKAYDHLPGCEPPK